MYESVKRVFQVSGRKMIHLANTDWALNYALGTLLGPGDTEVKMSKILLPHRAYALMMVTDEK